MVKFICTKNGTVEEKLTIGKEYEVTEMESFNGVDPTFLYVNCDDGSYEPLSIEYLERVSD